jgi:hypothetical protein
MFIHATAACGQRHRFAATARRCERGETFACAWAVEYAFEGEPYVRDCGATAWEDERGWECEAGHAHVFPAAREREGWEYAEDEQEAGLLARAGVGAVAMDGSAITSDPRALRHV